MESWRVGGRDGLQKPHPHRTPTDPCQCQQVLAYLGVEVGWYLGLRPVQSLSLSLSLISQPLVIYRLQSNGRRHTLLTCAQEGLCVFWASL